MDTSLNLNSRHLVTLSFDSLVIYAGAGVHHAALPVKFRPAESVAGTAIDVSCVVYLRDPTRRWLGDAHLEAPRVLAAFATTETLYFPLSDEQINFLEREATEPDMHLDLEVRAQVTLPDGQQHSVYASDIVLTIRREEWLRQLANIQRASWLVVGLVGPAHPGALEDIAQHLRDAKRLLDNAEYPSAATAVRKCLEIIRAKYLPTPPPAEREIVAGKATERPYEHRLLMLFHSAWSLANLAPHADPEAARFTWTRPHVDTLLAMTYGIAAQISAGVWPLTFGPSSTP